MADLVDIERGLRVRAIREARGETQTDFAIALSREAAAIGLPVRYDVVDVSKRETARKTLDAEDFALVALLDPEKRGQLWVMFGQTVKVGRDAWETLAGPPVANGYGGM